MSQHNDFTFPESLLRSIATVSSIDNEALISAHNKEAGVSVRVNPFKSVNKFESAEKVQWAVEAYYLPERISFIKDPLFHAGTYYVQEASSMFLEQAIKQNVDLSSDIKALDLCASPGGKSTHINSLISEGSLLISNEVIKSRVGALAENMSKWGTANVLVSNNDPKDFSAIENYFDLIVVDAPCSGSGLFRKQSDAIDHWSEENVLMCSDRQNRILNDIVPSLADGGVLIYSTCSYSTEENEKISEMIVKEFGLECVRVKYDPSWGVVETNFNEIFGYRFFPHLAKGEGFYISVFKKQGVNSNGSLKTKKVLEPASQKELQIIQPYLQSIKGLYVIKQKEYYCLINGMLEKELPYLSKQLFFRKRGTLIGEIKGKDLVPDHELALSIHKSKSIPSFELSEEQALKFLKKEEVKIEGDAIKGFCLVTYQGQSIGWIKHLGNRINNYFPKEWRILMEI